MRLSRRFMTAWLLLLEADTATTISLSYATYTLQRATTKVFFSGVASIADGVG